MGPDTIKEIMCDQPIARLSRPDENRRVYVETSDECAALHHKRSLRSLISW